MKATISKAAVFASMLMLSTAGVGEEACSNAVMLARAKLDDRPGVSNIVLRLTTCTGETNKYEKVLSGEAKAEYIEFEQFMADGLEALNRADLLAEVRPGGVDGSPFWNVCAKQFLYAPAFDFKPVANARRYRFEVTDADGRAHVFEADSPTASLSPVWREVAVGNARVVCAGVGADGADCGAAGERTFYRAAPFEPGAYPPAARGYAESARRALACVMELPHVKCWKSGEIDKTFQLNCFPSKMVQGAVLAMARYAEICPEAREEALAIAEGAAQWMMRHSVEEPESLRGLPITFYDYYEETKALGDKYDSKKIAHERRDQIWLIYPPYVATAFLRLWHATGKRQYFDYARNVADRYLGLQREDGSWPLVVEFPSGRAPVPNDAGATVVCQFLETMSRETGDVRYRQTADRALPSILRFVETFDWEGQFEDTAVQRKPYANLSKHIAADTMIYLLDRDPGGRYVKAAREALRFAEDQFVAWSRPAHKSWFTPGVIEQYSCAVTINSSFAKMIKFYLKLYEKEGNPLDLAKARALGDSLTRGQMPDGMIPTVLPYDPGRAGRQWVNCTVAAIEALDALAALEPPSN